MQKKGSENIRAQSRTESKRHLIWNHVSGYKFRSLFFRNLLISISLIIMPLLALSFVVIHTSGQSVREEIKVLTTSNINRTSDFLDTLFLETDFMAASLSLHSDIGLYMFADPGDTLLQDKQGIWNISKALKTFIYTKRHIHSIYIYSEKKQGIITSLGQIPLDSFDDKNWMEAFRSRTDNRPFKLSRLLFDDFPQVLSVIKPLQKIADKNPLGAIVININLDRLEEQISGQDVQGEFYIIAADGQILYSDNRDEIGKNGSQFLRELIFQRSLQEAGFLYEDGETHILAGKFSPKNDLTYLIRQPLHHFNTRQKQATRLSVSLVILSIAAALGAAILLSWNSYLPISNLMAALEEPEELRSLRSRPDEIRFIANQMARNLETNHELKEELADRLSLLDHTRTAALQAQINPHFLYNTLETIRWEAIGLTGGDNTVSKMIYDLARLLRLSLETEENIIPVRNEVEHACMFVRILKARYPNKLTVNWKLDDDLMGNGILKLCLQPLIENAFYHGIKPTRIPGIITISGKKTGSFLEFTVADNGKGISPDILSDMQEHLSDRQEYLKEAHIGLRNVNQRIKLVFGSEYGLSIESILEEGTRIILTFPLQEIRI